MSRTTFWIKRDDNIDCLVAKIRYYWIVYVDGKDTGYKFKTKKEAIEYCNFGF